MQKLIKVVSLCIFNERSCVALVEKIGTWRMFIWCKDSSTAEFSTLDNSTVDTSTTISIFNFHHIFQKKTFHVSLLWRFTSQAIRVYRVIQSGFNQYDRTLALVKIQILIENVW